MNPQENTPAPSQESTAAPAGPIPAVPITTPNASPVTEDPGKGLGIAGLVLAFFIPLLGLILSLMAKSKSKKAGFNNQLAKIGIIASIVIMVINIPFSFYMFNNLIQSAENTSVSCETNSVQNSINQGASLSTDSIC